MPGRKEFLQRLGRDPANPLRAAPAPEDYISFQRGFRAAQGPTNPRYMLPEDYTNFGSGVQPSPVGPGMLPQYPLNSNLVGIAGGDWNALPRGRALIESALPAPTTMPTQGLLVRGNIGNLYDRRTLYNPGEGNYSTISTTSFQPDRGPHQGREVLIPTVVGGIRLTDQQAQERFYRTGEHLGVFAKPEDADKYSWWLHWEQVRRGGGSRPAGE